MAVPATRFVRTFVIFESAWRDVRYALRALSASPGFACAATATIALAIGASTAMFSVAYGVVLRPLPYPDPERLVRLYEAKPSQGQFKQDVSEPAFHAWRRSVDSVESMAMYSQPGPRFLNRPDQLAVTTMGVSPTFFQVIGVAPILGPGFKPETFISSGDDAVLSYTGWQRLFGGRADVIGETIEFSGVGEPDPYRIVGVMPEDFFIAEPADVWLMRFIREPVSRSGMIWNWRYDRVIARLRPGAGIDRARAELETVASRIAAERPASNAGWTVTVERLHDSIVGSFRRVSWLLLASVVVILLVACLNVGGLLIARAIARERETAVRVALGAGRLRVIGLWLAEASTIATAGGVVGVLLGWWGLLALKAAAPPGIPRIEAIALDWQALASVAVSIGLAIVIFTLAPLPPGHRRLADRLRSGGSASDAPARSLLGTALTMAQCAGATVLVVLAVLLTRSFIQLMGVDLGWNPAGIVRFNVSPRTPPELRSPWFVYVDWSDRLIGELEALPEVERAAVTTQVPLSPDSFPATLGRGRGAAAKDEGRWPSIRHSVSDGYFNVMGIRLVSGRLFDGVDRYNEAQLTGKAPRDRGVAIVSAQTARVLWPDRPALGESIWGADNVDGIREVVGVVEDIQFHAVGETPALHVFIPWTQAPTGRPRLLARARDLTPATIDSMRAVIERMEPDTRIESIVPLEDLVGNATAQPRFASRIVAGFGGLALVLAAVGVYGTLASLVRARRQELGIRIALGAPLNAIVSRVLVQAFVPAAVGALIGLGTAAALAGRFRALLFNIEPLDRSSYFFGAIILLLVALAAALAPALRASRIDPAQTLKAE